MSVTLITGGAGFVGTNTAERILANGGRVRVLDSLARPGVEQNLRWLERRHGSALEVELGDVRDSEVVNRALHGAVRVFHFAAQVAVTTSLDAPLDDASVNIQGTLNLLEAARRRSRPPSIVFTSTNKIYGSLLDVKLREQASRYEPVDSALRASGIDEHRPLHFCTPYGCSKGAADQYVLDYAASYGLATIVFRMSCIYGPHQFGTEDQGWVAHFLIRAIDQAPITIYGDGKQVRDILYVEDLVDALLLAQCEAGRLSGRAFNIGGGPANTVSLLEVLGLIAELRRGEPELSTSGWRRGDQLYYVSDHNAFTAATSWEPRVHPHQGIGRLHRWLVEDTAASAAPA